jgi:hypothetical protein
MSVLNLKTTALALVAGASLAGCSYGPYGGLGVGVGYNNGYYDPYYNGGYYGGSGYYGASYGSGYGSGYGYGYPYSGYGYGSPYYGWYNGFYYPGSGYYVYDRHRNRHRWTDAQRRYWERQRNVATTRGGAGRIIENWADFQNGPRANNTTVRQQTVERQRVLRGQQVTREQVQTAEPRRRTARTVVQQEQGRRGDRRKRHTQQD